MTPVLDPSHFTRAVTNYGDKRPLVVERAIYNAHGVKIIDKGVRVDSRLYERLTQHQLEVPLADCLQARPVPTAPLLRQRAEALISQQPFLAALLSGDRQRDHLLDELTHLPLPKPVSLQLAVLEESQPVAWAYALRSMLIAGWLAGVQDGGTRHDMRMLAAGGLLYDIGMLHLDPVLQRPQQELSAEQRRHLYTHPLVSVLLLERHHEYPPELLRAVREHHECLDGSGYPRGIAGEAIGGWGRILGLTKLVAALSAPGVPAAAQRLSVALRMNRHRYHTPLAREIERAIQKVPPTAPAGDAPDPLQTLPEIERTLAAWPDEPPPPLDSGRRAAAEVVRGQCAQVLRLLHDAGVGREALAGLAAQGLSDAERVELTLVAREAGWQLRVVARQARRRIRDSEGPLPPWLESWLADADALCARLLADAAPA